MPEHVRVAALYVPPRENTTLLRAVDVKRGIDDRRHRVDHGRVALAVADALVANVPIVLTAERARRLPGVDLAAHPGRLRARAPTPRTPRAPGLF